MKFEVSNEPASKTYPGPVGLSFSSLSSTVILILSLLFRLHLLRNLFLQVFRLNFSVLPIFPLSNAYFISSQFNFLDLITRNSQFKFRTTIIYFQCYYMASAEKYREI